MQSRFRACLTIFALILSALFASSARAFTINRFTSAIGVTLDPGEQSANLNPDKDTTMDSLSANSNLGNLSDLFVQTVPNSGLIVTQRTLVSFNLAGLPSNANIVGAFYGFGITGTGGDLTTSAPPPGRSVEIRRVGQPAWTEGGATWNTYDGTNPWSAPGGGIASSVSSSLPLTTLFRFVSGRSSPINKFFGLGTITGDIYDVTADAVAQFATTKRLDLAVKLDNDTTNGAAIGFSGPSRQSGSGFMPQLFLIYTVPATPPPAISSVTAVPQRFSPNASFGVDDFTTINYGLSQNANVTIKVLNSASSLVRSLISLSPRTAGTNGEIWDGRNDSGVLSPNGTYTFTIDAVGGSGSAVQQSSTVVIDNGPPPSISGVQALPYSFSPAVSIGTDDTATLNYTLSLPADVTVRIFNSSGTLVRGLITSAPKLAGPNGDVWDGANNSGSLMPNGIYTFTVDASTGSGAAVQKSSTVVIDNGPPPTITLVQASPAIFSPNASPGSQDATAIGYTLSQAANATVRIFNSGGTLVRDLVTFSPRSAGSNSESWDGRDNLSQFVADGAYSFTIDASSGAGGAVQQSGTVTVDNQVPVIATNLFAIDRISANRSIGIQAGPGEQIVQVAPGSSDGKDTILDSGTPDTNYGTASDLFLQASAAGPVVFTRRSAVGFDLAVLPPNSTVKGAFFGMAITGLAPGLLSGGPPPGRAIEVHRLLQPAWTQGGATWNSYNGLASWITAGGDFSPTIASSMPLSTAIITLGGNYFPNNWTLAGSFGAGTITGDIFDVTADAASQFASSKRADWMLKYDNDRTNPAEIGISMPSSESASSNFQPRLVIVYSNHSFGPSLNPGAAVTVDYRLSKAVNATIKILNGVGGLVRDLAVLSPRSAGDNSETWDGRDNSSQLVADGVYTMTIDGLDAAGNSATQTVKITVDNTITVRSADTTLTLTSTVPGMSVAQVPSTTPNVSLALASATAQGLILVSSVYDITPSQAFSPPASIVFKFDPLVITDTSTLAVFRFDGVQWSSVPATGILSQQVLIGADGQVTASISHSSLWALFIKNPDSTLPTLSLVPISGSTVTTATPSIVAAYEDAGSGISTGTLRLVLDGLDVTGSAIISTASASFIPAAALAQGTHTISAQVADRAANSASASSAFFIDSLPPLTTLLINGLAAGSTNLVLASTDTVSFAASDSGVGVFETRYSVDGATEVVFTTAFFLSPGSHALAFHSRDRAGNQEAAKTATIFVTSPPSDITPPLVRLDYPADMGLGVEQAIGGIVNVRGSVSDASAVNWTLEAAAGASATSGFASIASGVGNLSGLVAAWNTASLSGYQTLRLRAADGFDNAAQAVATVFVGNPVFTFAIGRKDSNVIVNKIKNPTGIAIRADGLIWVASTSDEDELLLLTSSGTIVAEVDGDRDNGHGQNGHGHGNGHDDDDEDVGFKNPQGLALDAANNLYVTDKGNDRVVKLSPDGSQVLLQIAKLDSHGKPKPGSGAGELRQPQDVAVDANGDIYVADSGNRRIQAFDPTGAFLRQFGQGILLSTSEVRGIALTTEGLWVSDKEQERVYLFSRAGALIKSIGDADSSVGEISRMRGLASDRLGALYMVEPNRDRTQKFDPQGKGLLAFGSNAGLSRADKRAKRYLTQPIDAAVAPDGSIWITDTGRDRIVRYALPISGYTASGEIVSSSADEPAARVVDHKDGAKVERDDGAGVTVPKGALAADLEITVGKGDENLDKEQKTAKRQEMKIQAVSEEVQYGPEGTTFNTPVTLTLPYDANLIASLGIKEDELKVYYWNPTLKDWQAMPSTVDKQNKTVNAQTTHFSAYQVGGLGGIGVAALDDFGLRDGYAFPNPSRNGSAVTFRMQPGSVDSIEVRVYDVSGRKIHSSSNFRFLGAIDDGNGKGVQNTYDHAWDVSGVGSGVYTFVMTARKAGQSDIRKTGKVGVIK